MSVTPENDVRKPAGIFGARPVTIQKQMNGTFSSFDGVPELIDKTREEYGDQLEEVQQLGSVGETKTKSDRIRSGLPNGFGPNIPPADYETDATGMDSVTEAHVNPGYEPDEYEEVQAPPVPERRVGFADVELDCQSVDSIESDLHESPLLNAQGDPAGPEDPNGGFTPGENKSEAEKKKSWDLFTSLPEGNAHAGDNVCYEASKKVLKVVLYIFLFSVVLSCGIVTVGTLLFAASNLFDTHAEKVLPTDWDKPDFPLVCLNYRRTTPPPPNTTSGDIVTNHMNCLAVPPPYADFNGNNLKSSLSCLWPRNATHDEHVIPIGPQEAYYANMCPHSSAQWVWCLFLIQCTPYAFKFFRCLWYMMFKKKKMPAIDALVIVLLIELLHTLGTCMFLYNVLPLLNNVLEACAIMPAVAFLPSVLIIFRRPDQESLRPLKLSLDILCCLAQLSALILWPVLIGVDERVSGHGSLVWSLPFSLFLISLGWWENYIDADTRLGPMTKLVLDIRNKIRKGRTKLHMIVNLCKIFLTLGFMAASLAVEKQDFPLSISEVFKINFTACSPGGVNGTTRDPEIGAYQIGSITGDWVWVWFINVFCGMCAYFAARAASKAQIQRFSYALPLMCVSPCILMLLMGGCHSWKESPCTFSDDIPTYFFFKCYSGDLWNTIVDQQLYMFVIWWLSQMWITRHIWYPRCERLAKTDKLFVSPLYDAVLLEQSLLHNRNRRDEPKRQTIRKLSAAPEHEIKDEEEHVMSRRKAKRQKEEIPMIHFCATMWHESDEEMINFLKSVFRSDIDQAARRMVEEHMDFEDPDFYEFEAHVFFDDAMQAHDIDGGDEYQVNSYVKLLVSVINKAARTIHKSDTLTIRDPVKYPTPYGGRLEWTLPGGNKIIAHLKDKIKIRHKKRWSQVMYMYYFLGHRLIDRQDLTWRKKQKRAENTFLLALDGDVDFEPIAVSLLVDLMKRNPKLGAACGRIHPIGSGPMVWYQQFEYALGHWMQKATEHVIGCVLCSPGCFSLFRGSSLMDENVMNTYTTTATQAKHFVQYDQGEDRWLCTLLLQQGYRVEYCAASDALTAAPEAFKEFYNQRRRWGPSTMANIMDLLMSWRKTTARNEDISFLYITYQTMILILSLLGPGTIFLMIVGALEVALNERITMWTSFIINFVPVLIFVIMCFTTQCDTQVTYAYIMTGIYAIVQMVVLVGVAIQMSEQGPCSPPFVFFFYVAGTFLLAAIIHPQEFFCVIHGVTYFLAIPSMYMLLIIYSMCNLHVVSWGTREVKQTKTEKQLEEEKALQQEQKKAGKSATSISGIVSMVTGASQEEGFTVGFGNLFRCICCPTEKKPDSDPKFTAVLRKLDMMEDSVKGVSESVQELKNGPEQDDENEESAVPDVGGNWSLSHTTRRLRTVSINSHDEHPSQKVNPMFEADEEPKEEKEEAPPSKKRDELINPSWIEDEDLLKGPQGKLTLNEEIFFQELIETYLKPLEKNKVEEERVSDELKELRNSAAGAFLMLNAIFTVTISVLQLNMDTLAVPWPCGDNLRLEPIGFMFLFLFVAVMLLQTFGMLVHRGGTMLHTVSTTLLNCEKKTYQTDEKQDEMRILSMNDAVALAKDMCIIGDASDDATSVTTTTVGDSDNDEATTPRNRKTVKKLRKKTTKRPDINRTMDATFKHRFEALRNTLETHEDGNIEADKKTFGKRHRTTRRSLNAFKYLQEQQKMRGGWQSERYNRDNVDVQPRRRNGTLENPLSYLPEEPEDGIYDDVGMDTSTVHTDVDSIDESRL